MRRSGLTALVMLPLLLPLAVLAQQPHSSKRKAPPPAVLGSAKEEAREVASPARGKGEEADRSLLRALLYAFEPAPREIRVIAVEDLALLGDPRALDPLAHLVLDPDPSIALAAVRAVTHFQHPRAEELLGNVIRHPSLSPDLKVAAVQGLPFQGTPSARALLVEMTRSTAYVASVRTAARTTLAGLHPPPGTSK